MMTEKCIPTAGILEYYNIIFGVYLSYVMQVHQFHSMQSYTIPNL